MWAAGLKEVKQSNDEPDSEQRRLLAFVRSAYSDRELESKVRRAPAGYHSPALFSDSSVRMCCMPCRS